MGKKKVIGEDGKTYVVSEHEPFYKKIWFWILAVIIVILIGYALNRGSDDNTVSDNGGEKVTKSSTSTSSTKKEESETFYEIGDTVKVGDAEYTLSSVELTDERNEFASTSS